MFLSVIASLWIFNPLSGGRLDSVGFLLNFLLSIALSLIGYCVLIIIIPYTYDFMKDKTIKLGMLEKTYNDIYKLYLKEQNLNSKFEIDVKDFWEEFDLEQPISLFIVNAVKDKIVGRIADCEKILYSQQKKEF